MKKKKQPHKKNPSSLSAGEQEPTNTAFSDQHTVHSDLQLYICFKVSHKLFSQEQHRILPWDSLSIWLHDLATTCSWKKHIRFFVRKNY